MTFEEYKQFIEETYGECDVLHANSDHTKKNCGGTGNRKAPKGISWIDYWRAMTGNHSNILYCSSCGKEIFVGEPTEEQQKRFTKSDDTVEKHRAQGGHVWVNATSDNDYSGGRYVTPLCPECNGQHDKHILIKKGATYCKELGATTTY